MEENKNEEKVVDTEELKKETVDTVNQVKDTIKNVDIKNDAKEATGFVSAMFKDPFGAMKEIVNDNTNKHFKTAIVFLAIWTIAVFADAVLSLVMSKYLLKNLSFARILSIIKLTVAPIISVLALSLIEFVMNKNSKKSLITVITAITVAKIPVIIAEVISLLTLISSNASSLTNRISSLCAVISTVLTYFTLKGLFGEEQNSKFIKRFVIVEAIYYVVSLVVCYLGIYI